MNYRDKVKRIFYYLLNLKELNQKYVKNIYDCDRLYWEDEFSNISNSESWVEVNKNNSKLYKEFFNLYQENEKNGENFEIVFGHGLIVWKVENEKIVYPVLSTRMKIEFNKIKETFVLIPSAKTTLETFLFEDLKQCNISNIFDLEDKVNESNLDPRNIEEAENVFLNLLSNIDEQGTFNKGKFSRKKINFEEFPVIYDTSVILARKNNMKLWEIEINNIIKQIDSGYKIPETIKALVDEKDISYSEEDVNEWKNIGQDLLFPLPANSDQKEIIKRISENYGVVVQGPPGTGKSHTIVNLICHLLAYGKRILVTSQTSRALKVLTEKIPEEIRPLCISVLGNDANSLNELNESVRKITDNLSEDPEVMYEDIKILERRLNYCRKNQQALYEKFKQVEKLENYSIDYEGKNYNTMYMAKWVKDNRDKYNWIDDKVEINEVMPVSEKEFDLLIYLLGELDKSEKCHFDSIKNIVTRLPDEEEFCSKIQEYKKLGMEYEKCIKTVEGWHIPYNDRCDYGKLLKLIEECKSKISYLEEGMWGNIMHNYYNSNITKQTLKDLLYKSNNYILMLSRIRNQLRNHKIELPSDINMDKFIEKFNILYSALNENKKISKLFIMLHPEYNYILENCKVDGKPLKSMSQAMAVKLYTQQEQIFKELRTIWNNTIKDYGGKIISSSLKEAELISVEKNLDNLSEIVNWDTKYKKPIIEGLGRISIPQYINWHKKETYDYLIKCVKAIGNINKYNQAKAYIEVFKKTINTSNKLKELYDAIEDLDTDKIRETLSRLKEMSTIKNKSAKIDELIGKINKVCPDTARKIIDNWSCASEKFNNWGQAWRWAQWNSFLNNIYSLNSEILEESIEQQKNKEKSIIKDIVSKKTWYNEIRRTTENQKRSLFSWLQAVKRIGKGRGKMVPEYRKIAQNEMEKCKEVIPVWIMPLNRIIENVKLSKDMFDVIIFDESSQSDIFSLCALMRAKRAVIVGDDKQISPETVGIDQSVIYNLIDKYLKGIPQREWFDLQTSLYDTSLRVFPSRLMLKEHFRCIPEIINFSNDLSYSGEILPLRYPKIHEKFYPPINTIRVKEGARDPIKPINVKEAECLVDKVVSCCKDARYSNMSMGVISLLGEAQGHLIESMLREKIGVEEMIRRKLICGDAYSFQGDERDIMFLSMVISNDVKFAPLMRENDIRRFNVASSRAKNQMWLFYSIELEDLNVDCARYYLLNYCLNYDKYYMNNKNIEYIFQSKLQKDVYNIIKNKGYNVIPEVKIGRYKIDFIVEGVRNRVAIICDGDVSSEKYNWEETIERQLDLQRVGWIFYRIRGSEFYYNPEKVMNKLWEKLSNIGMEQYKVEEIDAKNLKAV
ncbi:AAA domain-containing protein [Clostridium sp. WILCCON 0269]|uniref:AAA domain-containing protein n=1 Tax=Candidatus Clostridium eludens TaxID=3381663 RepID=A0ABW8SHV0_9CLOT